MAIPLLDVIASNARLASRFPNGLVGVFVGGTSGIGEYTAKALARNVPNSKVLVVGRSQEAADRIKSECQQYNTNCSFEFIKTDLSALKNVDELCSEIKSRENHINILFQTQGSLGFNHSTNSHNFLALCLPTSSPKLEANPPQKQQMASTSQQD